MCVGDDESMISDIIIGYKQHHFWAFIYYREHKDFILNSIFGYFIDIKKRKDVIITNIIDEKNYIENITKIHPIYSMEIFWWCTT